LRSVLKSTYSAIHTPISHFGMSSLSYRKLRAPDDDGTALIDPPPADVPAMIAANRAAARDRDLRLGLRRGFCADARQRMLPAGAARDADSAPTVIMTGHQPTLFHPGVWFKNFLVSSIAQSVGGAAVNLVVDSDTVRVPGIPLPTGVGDETRLVEALFDAPGDEVPWEERRLVDPQLFASFPRRVHETLPPLLGASGDNQPLLVDRLWPLAVEQPECQRADAERKSRDLCTNLALAIPDECHPSLAERSVRPGWCLAAARHELERQAGLTLYQSLLSELSFWFDFGFFAEVLIARCAEFQAAHNAALAEYRALNGIRSHSHPVPGLARDGEWVEVPLWIWSRDNPRRRRVFARRVAGVWELTDRETIMLRPVAGPRTDMPAFMYVTLRDGVTLRPRALLTTMYARLVLSDLFIHGIGGAKYDELTDEIIRRFFGIEPPRYLTATATFRLPIERPNITIDDVRDAARLVRNVRYRPESLVGHPLLANDAALERELQALAAEKRRYVRSHTIRRGSHDVFAGLERINASMYERLKLLEAHLRAEHSRLTRQLQQARTLGSREFSFVLYPEEYLVPRLLALASPEK
jgi:hypothetical protein